MYRCRRRDLGGLAPANRPRTVDFRGSTKKTTVSGCLAAEHDHHAAVGRRRRRSTSVSDLRAAPARPAAGASRGWPSCPRSAPCRERPSARRPPRHISEPTCKPILSSPAEQRARYLELRGYGAGDPCASVPTGHDRRCRGATKAATRPSRRRGRSFRTEVCARCDRFDLPRSSPQTCHGRGGRSAAGPVGSRGRCLPAGATRGEWPRKLRFNGAAARRQRRHRDRLSRPPGPAANRPPPRRRDPRAWEGRRARGRRGLRKWPAARSTPVRSWR